MIVISQINLLLSLVNDMMDIKLIEQGDFVPKIENFKPNLTFQFIKSMFEPSMKHVNSSLSLAAEQDVE